MKIALIIITLLVFSSVPLYGQQCGDVNNDGIINATDVGALYDYLVNGYNPSNIDSGNVDGNCIINIADLCHLANYEFGGPPPMCADTSTCSYPTSPGNYITIGIPPYTIYPGGDSMAIPMYLSNTDTLYGLSLGFYYPSADIEITSVEWSGSVVNGAIGYGASFNAAFNEFFILDAGHILGVCTAPQAGGLLTILNAQILSGNPEQYLLELEPVFYPPGGNFIFVKTDLTTLKPTYIPGTTTEIHVTSLDDSGEGTLRWAIDSANVESGIDTIFFDISGTVSLSSTLPSIDDNQTVILGSSAPGGANSVILDGTGLGSVSGLVLNGDNVSVNGLTMTNWDGRCILIDGDNNTVTGCHVGVNQAGDTRYATGNGINISGNNNMVGGCDEGDRNLIAGGNSKAGIYLEICHSNSVIGNYIGLSATGGALIDPPSSAHGVYLYFCTEPNYIGQEGCPPNCIANNMSGIYIFGSHDNEIENNLIGMSADTALSIPNYEGITVNGTAKHNIIGPDCYIYGSIYNGISFNSSGSDSNIVKLNTITASSLNGIYLTSGANYNKIGGHLEGNDIYGNTQNGVYVYGGTSHTSIIENQIGGGYDNPANGNGYNGITIESNSNNNIIQGNIISFNGDDGITVEINSRFNTLTQNEIFLNGELGIDLNDDGVTANDAGDTDTGPNDLLNYPVIDSVVYNDSDTNFTAYGTAADSAIIEFFAAHIADDDNTIVDPSGHGEAYTYIGSDTADDAGDFVFEIDKSVKMFSVITATATDTFGNTSEFSENYALDVAPLIIVGYTTDAPPGQSKQGNWIDMIVYDPNGDSISVGYNTIPTGTYVENTDNDSININRPLPGEYIIVVIGEEGAPGDVVYGIGIRIDGSLQAMLVGDQEIPSASQTDEYSYTVEEGYHFENGDPNGDGVVNLTDILDLITCVYVTPGVTECEATIRGGDVNCDGQANLTDILNLIQFVYVPPLGEPEPCNWELEI